MTHDRTYWRASETRRLIDEAKHYPSIELCIAIGERLDDLSDYPVEVEELREELRAAENLIEYLRGELRDTEQELTATQDALAQLAKG